MTNLKETAEAYEAPKIKNISELNSVSVELEVQEETECEFPYKFVMVDGERYKVNNSVLADMKEILIQSPEIKNFKITKKGEGLKTKYTVIPLN